MKKPSQKFCREIGCVNLADTPCKSCKLPIIMKQYKMYNKLGSVYDFRNLILKENNGDGIHIKAYLDRLKVAENIPWNKEEMEEVIMFPVTRPDVSLLNIKKMKPREYVAFINGIIKAYRELVENDSDYKKKGYVNADYKTIVSRIYNQMGSLVDHCQQIYFSMYDEKPNAVLEILSEFPVARFEFTLWLSVFEKRNFYTQKEIFEKELQEKKREEEEERERKKEQERLLNESNMLASYYDCAEIYSTPAYYAGEYHYRIRVDKKSDIYMNRKKNMDLMIMDILEKYPELKNKAKVSMYIIDKMSIFNNIIEETELFWKKVRNQTTRPERIAASQAFYNEFVHIYTELIEKNE